MTPLRCLRAGAVLMLLLGLARGIDGMILVAAAAIIQCLWRGRPALGEDA